MVVSFSESLSEVMPSLLLACTTFQEQCTTIGRGVMMTEYLTSVGWV